MSYKADCSIAGPAPGCKSYNEMVEKNDKDILAILKGSSTFVCFRQGEDTFVVLSYRQPLPTLFHQGAASHVLETFGIVLYRTYTDGVVGFMLPISGRWTKAFTTDSPVFTSRKDEIQASVLDAEVSFSYPFKNRSGTTTRYDITIRRSTLRFVETYDVVSAQRKAAG